MTYVDNLRLRCDACLFLGAPLNSTVRIVAGSRMSPTRLTEIVTLPDGQFAVLERDIHVGAEWRLN